MCLKSTDTDVGEGYECGLYMLCLSLATQTVSVSSTKKKQYLLQLHSFLERGRKPEPQELYLLLYPPRLLAAAAAAAAKQLVYERGPSGERHFRQQLSD